MQRIIVLLDSIFMFQDIMRYSVDITDLPVLGIFYNSMFPLPYRFISVFLYCGSNTHRIVLISFHDFDFLLRYYVYNRNQLKDYPKLYITILLLFSSKLFSVIFIMLFHFQTFDVFECCDKPF